MDKLLPNDDARNEDGYPMGLRDVNYGRREDSNGNGKAIAWLMGGLMSLQVLLTGAFIIWAGGAIVQMQTDVAVIKCQLSPQCPKVTINGQSQDRP